MPPRRSIACEKCGLTFLSRRDSNNHKNRKIPCTASKIHTCNKCNITFKRIDALQRHELKCITASLSKLDSSKKYCDTNLAEIQKKVNAGGTAATAAGIPSTQKLPTNSIWIRPFEIGEEVYITQAVLEAAYVKREAFRQFCDLEGESQWSVDSIPQAMLALIDLIKTAQKLDPQLKNISLNQKRMDFALVFRRDDGWVSITLTEAVRRLLTTAIANLRKINEQKHVNSRIHGGIGSILLLYTSECNKSTEKEYRQEFSAHFLNIKIPNKPCIALPPPLQEPVYAPLPSAPIAVPPPPPTDQRPDLGAIIRIRLGHDFKSPPLNIEGCRKFISNIVEFGKRKLDLDVLSEIARRTLRISDPDDAIGCKPIDKATKKIAKAVSDLLKTGNKIEQELTAELEREASIAIETFLDSFCDT